jgi:type I restriction enzyme, S subunit
VISEENLPPLPDTWDWDRAKNVCLKIQDGTHFSPKDQRKQGTFKYVTAKNIRPWGMDLTDITYLNEQDHRAIYQRCDPQKGDVLLVKDGVNTGDAALNTLDEEFSLLSSVCVLRPDGLVIEGAFLRYYLQSPLGYRSLTGQMSGTAIKRIVLHRIRDLPVPIAPLPEQRRIVAEIETQFSRLDAAVAALERAQDKLKRYRAAVLVAACSGNLGVGSLGEVESQESASALVERTLAIRSTRVPKRHAAALQPIVTSNEVPSGWAVVSLDQLCVRITSGSRDWSKYYDRGVGTFLMAQNVRPMRLDMSFRQLVDPPINSPDRARSQVEVGDILVTIVGAGTGTACRVPSPMPESYVCQSVALLRPVDPSIAPYLEIYLNSPEHGQRQFEQFMYGQGRPHLGFDQIRTTRVLLPPPDELDQIVTEVERRLTVIEDIDSTLSASLKRAERMRRAILRRAFTGQLVPQDPGDEPAEALLERIREERAVTTAKRPETASGNKKVQYALW